MNNTGEIDTQYIVHVYIYIYLCFFQADSILWQPGRLLPDVVLHLNRVRGASSESAQNRFHLEEEDKVGRRKCGGGCIVRSTVSNGHFYSYIYDKRDLLRLDFPFAESNRRSISKGKILFFSLAMGCDTPAENAVSWTMCKSTLNPKYRLSLLIL